MAARAKRLDACGEATSEPASVITLAAIVGAWLCVTCKVRRLLGTMVKAETPFTLAVGANVAFSPEMFTTS